MSFLAFVLDEESKETLRMFFLLEEGKQEVLHHVTLFYNPPEGRLTELMEKFKDNKVYASSFTSDEKCSTIIVVVNGTSLRPSDFPGVYHITHSLAAGIKPVYSNELINKTSFPSNGYCIPLSGEIKLCN